LEKANVLVTGGAGFIGSHLVDALVDRGHRVRVLDALVSQVHGENADPAYLNSAAEFIQSDICDRDAVAAALEDIDIVFHEAAEVGVGQSMYEIERYVRERSRHGCPARSDPRAQVADQETCCCVVNVDLWRRSIRV
jgi:dTDP-L-rhamnose 4-epimerase